MESHEVITIDALYERSIATNNPVNEIHHRAKKRREQVSVLASSSLNVTIIQCCSLSFLPQISCYVHA